MQRGLPEKRSFWQIETLLHDVLYALRSLRKAPLFTLTAVGALVIGIGANTAIFSVIDQVLLKPLRYPDASRIVLFFVTTPQGPSYGGSAAKYNQWKQQTDAFEDVAAYEYQGSDLNIAGESIPEQVHCIRVSAHYFQLFGTPMRLGRPFTIQEDKPNAGHFAILSYAFWQRRFGGDPHIVGKTVSLGNNPYEVVGVVGQNFNTELDSPPDIFLPFQIDPASTDHARFFNVVGRLRPGATFALASARLQVAAQEFRRKFPNIVGPKDGFGIEPFQDAIVSDARSSLLMLSGAVAIVLLIACANVANLLLLRATGRTREIALRLAMGASRARIIRQLLTESVVLSTIGGIMGLVAGLWGVRVLIAVSPGDIPRVGANGSAISMDWRILLFSLTLSFVTGILFGLIPALGISRGDLGVTLREGGERSGTSHSQVRTRALLVTSEVAFAMVLLVGAGLLIRSLILTRTIQRGVDTHNVLTLRMSLAGSPFVKSSDVGQLVRQATQRLEDLPGVQRACASYNLPLDGVFGIPFKIVGRTGSNGRYDGRGWLAVSPGYFDAFRIPVLRGRVFTDSDAIGSERVAIVNRAMVRQYWPDGDPIGSRLILGEGYGPEFAEPPREIIGVVGDVLDLWSKAPEPVVYIPVAQVTDGITSLMEHASSLAWIVRTRAEPQSLAPAVENVLQQVTRGVGISKVRSMNEVVVSSTAATSFQMILLTIFGAASLFLAAIGIYGLMAYSTQQRTREIGVRMALGAGRNDIRNMVIFQGMRWAILGTLLGIGGALSLSRVLAGFLFQVKPWDPLTFCVVPAFLITVLLFAIWLPTRRATKVDPLIALRHE